MIILSIPPSINSVLGGNSPVSYDKMIISPLAMDAQKLVINAPIKLMSSTNPEMQEIQGDLSINTANGILNVRVPSLDFYRQTILTPNQVTAVNAIISDAQSAIEQGLITLNVVGGTQSPGV